MEFPKIPKSQNMIAGEVAKLASSEEGSASLGLEIEVQKHPSIKEISTFAIQSTGSWMTPIISTDTFHKTSRRPGRLGRK